MGRFPSWQLFFFFCYVALIMINSFIIILCVILYMLQSKDQKFTFHLDVKIKVRKLLQMHIKTQSYYQHQVSLV